MSSYLICNECSFNPADDQEVDYFWSQQPVVKPEPLIPLRLCPYCGLPNKTHSPSTGAPWLYRLCNGTLGRE